MKNVMILIVLIFIGTALCAQDGNEQLSDGYEKQIGLNATNFFLRFVSFNQGLDGAPSILLVYKKGTGSKKTRYGFGGRINLENRESDNSNNNIENGQDLINDQINDQINLSFNYGKEYYKMISKKWLILFGWETLYRGGFSKSKNSSFNANGKITNENTAFNLGIGAQVIGGIQFRINDRISLLTETSYGIFLSHNYSESISHIEDQVDNQNKSINKRYGVSTFYNAPLAIILNYHF